MLRLVQLAFPCLCLKSCVCRKKREPRLNLCIWDIFERAFVKWSLYGKTACRYIDGERFRPSCNERGCRCPERIWHTLCGKYIFSPSLTKEDIRICINCGF